MKLATRTPLAIGVLCCLALGLLVMGSELVRVGAGPLRVPRRHPDGRDRRRDPQGRGDGDQHIHGLVPPGHDRWRRLLLVSQPARRQL